MKLKLIFIALLFSSLLFAQQKMPKYSQAKIYYTNTTDLQLLLQHGVAVDHGNIKKNVFIESVFSEQEIAKAKSLGYQVVITIDDMKKHIANRKVTAFQKNASPCSSASSTTYDTPTNFNLGSMGGFLTLDEMLQELDDMHTLYPNLITTKSTINNFTTVEGRSIHWVKISDNPTVDEAEPEMLFTAIHHAREPASMQQLIFYMWYLLENYATNTEVQSIINNTQQFFVPILNVDGYRYNQTTDPNGGGFWRKNRKDNGDGSMGVDNNRNYSDHWNTVGTSGPNGATYAGTAPFSEVENQAIKWFTEQHNFIIALNNHTFSNLLLFPYGWGVNQETPDHDLYEAISGLMVSDNSYTNQLSADLYPAGGDSDDWMYSDTSTKNKIFAMTPEIGSSFWPNQGDIIPICKEMMFHNLTAAHLITNYADYQDKSDLYVTTLTGDFSYSIKRLGLQEPANFTMSIVPISANITSVGNVRTHNNMTILQEDNNSISYTLANSISNGDEIVYKLVLNNGEFNSEKIITKIYGNPQTTFIDNANSLTNYNNTNWDTTTAEYFSASSSITDSPFGNYNDSDDNSITFNNTISLANLSIAQASFYIKWDIESGWDYVQFEISTDNGSTWTPQCGKYTKNGTNNQGISGEPMYDGTQNDWVKEEVNLSNYLGQDIKFRFQLVSDTNTNGDGFYFDDFEIKTTDNTASLGNNELFNVSIYPNPVNNVLTVKIPNLIENTSIKLFSINGQLLNTTVVTSKNSQIDMSNLSTGVYFVNLQTDKLTKSFKIVKQ